MPAIYIAARYGRMDEMRRVHAALREQGYDVTSRWVLGEEAGKSQQYAAQMDVDDVRRADAVLLFTDPVEHLARGGGRFFEAGLAYGLGKPVFTVGPPQIIFHHLPGMFSRCRPELYQTLELIDKCFGCRVVPAEVVNI